MMQMIEQYKIELTERYKNVREQGNDEGSTDSR